MAEDNKKGKAISRAVALRYQPEKSGAPVIAAGGKGWLADRIVSLAKENDIPVIKDDSLVRVLGGLSLGEEVPSELYEAVAAIYAFVMEADRRKAGK